MQTQRNPVGWFEIYVEDMDRAKSFYQTTLDVTLDKLPATKLEMWAFPCGDLPGCGGALAKMEGKDPGGGGTIVYFSCADCAVEAARAAANGGRVHLEKMDIGEHGFISLVVDTEGNMVGLHSLA